MYIWSSVDINVPLCVPLESIYEFCFCIPFIFHIRSIVTNGVTNDTNVGITDTNDISDTNDTSDTDDTNDTNVGINGGPNDISDTNDTSDTDDTNDTNVGINGGPNTSFVLASALCIVFIAIK